MPSGLRPNDIISRIQKSGKELSVQFEAPKMMYKVINYDNAFGNIYFGGAHSKMVAFGDYARDLQKSRSENKLSFEFIITLPLRVEEQFTDLEGFPGRENLLDEGRYAFMNLEMMSARNSYRQGVEQNCQFKSVDSNISAGVKASSGAATYHQQAYATSFGSPIPNSHPTYFQGPYQPFHSNTPPNPSVPSPHVPPSNLHEQNHATESYDNNMDDSTETTTMEQNLSGSSEFT